MIYYRTIRLADTDAAGVLYFATGLSLCHEAYEEALLGQGVDLKVFFRDFAIAIPIVHGEIDFLRPVYCGDRLALRLTPTQIGASRFEVRYHITAASDLTLSLMSAKTIHVCINPQNRQKIPLTPAIQQWIDSYKIQSL